MSNGSFYGGRKGSSFVIAKNYPDIRSMTIDFAKGNSFLEVKYDEYVLINTINKNHPDNGKLFKRGYDYNSSRKISAHLAFDEQDKEIINGTQNQYLSATYKVEDINAGGAIYVGSIAGPAGRSPFIVMTSYQDAQSKSAQDGYTIQQSSGVYDITGEYPSLVPGKYYNEDNQQEYFNDGISWFSASLRTENNDDGIVYIGFKIPYPVIDFMMQHVSPYDSQGEIKNTIEPERVDIGNHPFYEKWNLPIPKGIKGDTPKNIYISTFTNNISRKIFVDDENYYLYDNTNFFRGNIYSEQMIEINQQDSENPILQLILNNQQYTIKTNTQIILYDLFNYDNKENPLKEDDDVKTYFLGIFNQIVKDSFIIEDNGDIHIDFTDGSSYDRNNFLKKINEISLTETTDTVDNQTTYTTNMNVLYNTFSQENGQLIQDSDVFNLKFIKDIKLEGADLTIWYTDGQKPTVFENSFVGIESVTTENNQLIITLNNGQPIVYNMAWVSGMRVLTDEIIEEQGLNKPSGLLQVQYNGLQEWHDSSSNIKWIDSMEFQQGDNGENLVIVNYNDETKDILPTHFKSIMSIQVDEDTNQLKIIYNTIDAETGQHEQDLVSLQGALIRDIQFDENTHQFVIHYTAGKADDTFDVNYPAEVIFQNEDPQTDDYRLKINSVNGDELLISSPIDSIYDTTITQDHHLAVMFSSAETRTAIINSNKNYPGVLRARDGNSYAGWLDLGSIFIKSGIFIGRNLDYEDLNLLSGASISDIVTALNNLYPNGLDDSQGGDADFLAEKVITVGASSDNKQFYGFDYSYISETDDYKGWYYLGSIDTSGYMIGCSMGTYEDFITEGSISDSVADNGLYFIIED